MVVVLPTHLLQLPVAVAVAVVVGGERLRATIPQIGKTRAEVVVVVEGPMTAVVAVDVVAAAAARTAKERVETAARRANMVLGV